MSAFRAGFGRSDITPSIGCQLMGYGNRSAGATGVHDPLHARALVLEDEGGRWALVSIEFCFVHADTVQKIRETVQRRVGIPASNIFIATTHTHAGPDDQQADNWERPLDEIVTDAVEAACQTLQPARIGSGYGFLYGYSINRRWLDRPVDPALAVIRIDDAAGRPLGLVTNFACHAVVLGYDNLLISGDWPGYACTKLEAALGSDTTCLFFQGGAGDINPIVAGVRKHLQGDQTVRAIGEVSVYYGSPDDPEQWNIGDRGGGTFEEVAELGEAFVAEVMRVAHRISSGPPLGPLWSEQRIVNAKADPDEPQLKLSTRTPPLTTATLINSGEETIPAEIMALGVGSVVWVGQPGEVFSETAVTYRTKLRLMGYAAPMLVSYANDRLSYLPVPEAFDEGGYEPGRAVQFSTSRHFQTRAWEAIAPVLRQRAEVLNKV